MRALVGACVFALTGHVRAHVKLCMCLCMHVWERMRGRLQVWASYLRFVCACVRTSLYACMIIILYYYMQAQCVRTSVRTRMYVRECECRPMCGRVYVHECARVGVLMHV